MIVNAMSDFPTTETPDEPLFSVAEVEQLTSDDVSAGRAIGKMLSALFLYTVFAMVVVIWWTQNSIIGERKAAAGTDVATEPAH